MRSGSPNSPNVKLKISLSILGALGCVGTRWIQELVLRVVVLNHLGTCATFEKLCFGNVTET